MAKFINITFSSAHDVRKSIWIYNSERGHDQNFTSVSFAFFNASLVELNSFFTAA